MRLESNQRRFKAFSPFSEKTQTFSVKLALVALNSYIHSYIIEILAVILEYAHLASQAILLYPALYSNIDDNSDDYPFQRDLIYAAKAINPSYLLSYGERNDSTETILILILWWVFMRYCIFGYVFVATKMNLKIEPILLRIFRWSLQLQVRAVYYFITSFFFSYLIQTKENHWTFLGIGRAGNIAVCVIIIAIELILAGFPKYRFHYLLPTKSFLASKNNSVECLTLFQKFLIQLLQVLLSQTAPATKWILTIVNLILTLVRIYKYFNRLPFYKINALVLQAGLVGIIASLHFTSLINLILVAKGTIEEGVTFLLITWIVLALLSIKASHSLLTKIIFKVLTENNYNRPDLLVHKIELMKQFLKAQKLPSELNDNNDWSNLVVNSILKNLDLTFFLETQSEFQFNNKSDAQKLFLAHLEMIVQKHPKSGFAKLYLAHYYCRKVRSYAKAITLIEEMRRETFSRIYLNACCILTEMQKSIGADYLANKDQIDIYTYVQSQVQLDKFKEVVLKQIDLQSSVCEELLNNSSDLNKISNNAKSAYNHKKQTGRIIKNMIDFMPEFYVRPLMLFAHYNLIINQSPCDYEKLYEMYNLRNQKYHKYFKSERLCKQNIYQDNCALFVISGQKADSGKIISCNYNVKRVFGGDPQWYVNSKLQHKIVTPSLRPMTETFFKFLSEPGALAIFGQTIKSYLYNKEGFVFETDFHLNVYPSLTLGYFTALFIRPVPEKKDFILVRENGEIEGASRKVCRRLGIFQPDGKQKKFHISEISPELTKATEAINTISAYDQDKIKYDVNITIKNQAKGGTAAAEKPPTIFIEEARRLFALYTERGNEVTVTPPSKNNSAGYRYFCKATNLVFDSVVVKLFLLEEIENDDESELDEIIEKISIVKENSENNDLMNTDEEEEESFEDCEIIDQEKENGWIDFGILQTQKFNSQTPFIKSEESVKIELTEAPFERKKKTKGLTRVIKKEQNPLKLINKLNLNNRTQTEIDNLTKPLENTTRTGLAPARVAQSAHKSISSLKSGTKEVSQTLRTALESKQSSKNLKTVLFIFSALLIFFFTLIVLLFKNLDKTVESLRLKKNVLISGQRRGYSVLNIEPILRVTHDIATGALSISDFDFFKNTLPGFVDTVTLYAQEIDLANQEFLALVDGLDADIKRQFYLQNVNMKFIDSDQKMTGFQAADALVQEVFNFAHTIRNNQPIDEVSFELIPHNLVNDFMIENRALVELSLTSANDQVDSVVRLNNMYIAITCTCTFLLICLLAGIIYLQYQRKRNNLTHLTKLSPFGIQVVLENCQIFKNILLEDGNFRAEEFHTFGDNLKNRSLIKNKRKQNFADAPIDSAIQKQFLLYNIKSVVLSAILTITLLTGAFFTPDSVNSARNKFEQIKSINLLGNRVLFMVIATLELPVGNGVTMIENKPYSVAIRDYITEINMRRAELINSFLDLDIVQDHKISQLLFGNACEFLGAPDAIYCNVLNKKATNSSLSQLLGAFENTVIQRTENYEHSDKSPTALKANRMMNYDLLVAIKRVVSDTCILIKGLLNKSFEEKLVTLNSQRKFGLVVSIISLFVVSGILWILVLRPIKEVDNDFKKALQIFPAKMILSNFPLRIFLLENSSIDATFIKNMS